MEGKISAQSEILGIALVLSGVGTRSGLRLIQFDSGQPTAASAATEALGAL